VKNRCGTAAFLMQNCLHGLKIAKFPVKFPDNREYSVETGSYLTAHTTIIINNLTFLSKATATKLLSRRTEPDAAISLQLPDNLFGCRLRVKLRSGIIRRHDAGYRLTRSECA
jgi:hypothetical protein